ncbi:TolB family protein, partial [Shewanella sp. 0m-11]
MKKTAIIMALASAGMVFSAQAASPTPFTVQDLVKMNKLHSAALSNDGTKIVYAVKNIDAEGKATTDLYLQDLSSTTAQVKQLTSAAGTEHSVTFGPNDNSIYFLAARDGSSQIYKLAL